MKTYLVQFNIYREDEFADCLRVQSTLKEAPYTLLNELLETYGVEHDGARIEHNCVHCEVGLYHIDASTFKDDEHKDAVFDEIQTVLTGLMEDPHDSAFEATFDEYTVVIKEGGEILFEHQFEDSPVEKIFEYLNHHQWNYAVRSLETKRVEVSVFKMPKEMLGEYLIFIEQLQAMDRAFYA